MLKMFNLTILHVRLHVQFIYKTQILVPVRVNMLAFSHVPVDLHVQMLNLYIN